MRLNVCTASWRSAGRSLVLSINADLTGQSADAVSFADRAVAAYDAAQSPHGRALARLQLLRVRKFSQEEKQAITERIIEDARLTGDRIIEGAALSRVGRLTCLMPGVSKKRSTS